MSSRENDIIDYFDDNSPHEDGTPFIPVRPGGGSDSWTRFFCGLLAGVTGGALTQLAPWLGGLLILIGYGVTAHTLAGSSRRSVKSLCFGFTVAAFTGGAVLIADCFWTESLDSLLDGLGRYHAIFLGAIFMPWTLAVIRYVYAVFISSERRPSGNRVLRRFRQSKLAR